MGIELPGELTEPLGWIGLIWPQADEDKLFEAGRTWLSYGSSLRGQAQAADSTAQSVWSVHEGDAVNAFRDWWNHQDGPGPNLPDNATAAELIGAGLIVMAGITLALKILFIAQLIILAIEVAQAIATAFATFGATTAEVPGFVAATRVICREALNKVISMVESEIARLFEQAAKLFEKVGAKTLAKDTARIGEKVATRSAQTREFAGLISKAERADVRSPKDGAVFWSGRDADKVSMRNYAERSTDNGVTSTTLEQTPGGKYFDDLDLYGENSGLVSDSQRGKIWGRLSQRYGENASGDVTAYVHDARPDGFWKTEEVPALRGNRDVTGITERDPVAPGGPADTRIFER
ncbi:hypothetical protein [uncultured Jatrophihabitans sp.]|uniref:WXG100-like domain-containing protein n=1 Tax=uncultured Jatrophihabitans sp. TaxID=1610747 RepID=UPI0035C98F7B